MLYRAATELSFIKKSSFNNDVTIEQIWIFELGVENSIDVPFYVILDFMQKYQFNQQPQKMIYFMDRVY